MGMTKDYDVNILASERERRKKAGLALDLIYYGDEFGLIDDGLLDMTFGMIFVHIQPLGPTLQHLQERESIRYWGAHFLSKTFYNSGLGVALFGIVELILCYAAIFGTAYAAIQLMIYAQTTRYWLDVLEKDSQKTFARSWLNLKNLKLYRTLAVLNGIHNEACSPVLWPITQHVLCTLHVICNVLIIKCFRLLPLPIRSILALSTFAFAFFEQSCLKAAADVYKISKRFRDRMGRDAAKRNRIVGKSLRCLRIQVSDAYHFKISTFVTFTQSVVENTINVMLTFF
ncbi:hypothetical protein Fcan01_22049 [Folsomia candida]|uniref:Uncharacterized protein n=1 Tax=Folsomia candida TaxID=158441 RepID=A0A226DF46_FOLCA|nr:hypothetical protein Fcan01_22049 [Folsomia candida]